MNVRQESLGFLLADVSRLMRRAFAQRLEGSALTFAQARALVHLSRHEGVHQVELANLLEVQPITLARLIDQLQGRGLVERRADPQDGRAYLLFLMPAAAEHLSAIGNVMASVRGDLLHDVDAAQAAEMLRTLARMRKNLVASGLAAQPMGSPSR